MKSEHQAYHEIIAKQREFFATGATLSLDFRIQQLKQLKFLLQNHESDIAAALHKDLGKPPIESILTELLLLYKEIDLNLKHLKKWIKPQSVATFRILLPARSKIYFEPYGTVLIIAPWNYPFLLVMTPLIAAISAGNCIMVKPSEVAAHTHQLIANLIQKYFSPEYITCIEANAKQMPALLAEKFDYIFFTGGASIGKIIMQAAAKHLTPVTLELGGKNPCIVDDAINISYAARRIIWAKLMNTGQTCVAPDYLFVHENCKDALIQQLIIAIKQMYGENCENNADYGKIINAHHFDRLINLMQSGKIIYGGKYNKEKLFIAPTLLDQVSWSDAIMQEEIFGPLLPIFTYQNFPELINKLKMQPKPLAAYLFTQNKLNEEIFISQLSTGGCCINDCIVQLINYHLPFGGVGESGMGRYHGKYSFETFSHQKSVFIKNFQVDINLQYPPYSETKLKWLRRFFKWF